MGVFWRNIDFEEEEAYKRFSILEVNYLHRWSRTSWSGECCGGDFIYILLQSYTLNMGVAETGYEEPKMFRVGMYGRKKNKGLPNFKDEIREYFLQSRGIKKPIAPPTPETREICDYMGWSIEDDCVADWLY